ncbi:hypothetical protein B0H11DRAFT_1713360 [Mycena galericulata]|nr:hypothetical protein B0H11DRAFT_1713360 [Mycena galericulata]
MQRAGTPAPQVPSFPQQPYNNYSANAAPYGASNSPYPLSAYSGAQYQPSPTSTMPSIRGAEPNVAGGRQCSHCGTMNTPLWRRDPTTHQTLCNACGVYKQQRHTPRPSVLIEASQDDGDTGAVSDAPSDGRECSNCHTRNTSVWRRNKNGDQVCNACGVYERLNGVPRPASLGPANRTRPRTRPSQG